MKKRLLSILLTACLLVGLLPTVALAADGDVNYLYCDENGANWQTGTKKAGEYTEITADNIGNYGTLNAGWYVVKGTVTASSRVTVTGNVHLILANGCTLTVTGGIQVQDDDTDINNGSPNALTIYGQTQPALDASGNVTNNVGKLTAQYSDESFETKCNAAIGGDNGKGNSGEITINGGYITATSYQAAAIGGGNGSGVVGGSGGTITINGGYVEASSTYGAAIGGGPGRLGGDAGIITINGGIVTASSTLLSAAIGGGGSVSSYGGDGGKITINGGTVTANGNICPGIGGGNGPADHSGTFQTNNGNAVIFATSIGDNDDKTAWSGVIFEGNEGKVYGTAVTPSEDFTIPAEKILTIESGKALTIPEGVTMTNEGTVENSGSIYVDGALSGTVGGTGGVYYPLTLTNCTGGQNTNTVSGKTYGKSGAAVTLTATLTENKLVTDWSVTGATGSSSGSSYTISSMPATPVTATANLADALTITTQPTGGTITYGETITLSVAVSKHSSVTGDLTYKWYEGSTAINGATSSSYTTPADLAAGDHTYHCVITCGTYTVTSGNATVTVNPLAEATPAISIDYENETLTGFVSGSSYAIDGTAVTTVDGKLSVADYIGRNISIVTKASDSNHADSKAQSLTIPARPAAPTPVGVNETIDGKNDGQITGVDNTMEYRKGAEGGWTACTGTAVTDLAPGTYQVRVKATGNSFASLSADVTIATGAEKTYTLNVTAPTFDAAAYGYTQPEAQAIIITSSGNWDSTISSMAVDSTDFIIDGSGDTVEAGGSISTWTVQPAAGLAAGSYTATITVTYNGGATAAATVSFTVTRAAQDAPTAPTVLSKTFASVTLNEIPDNANGAKAQYSMDGGNTWQDSPIFSGLKPTTEYSFVARYGETDNYFASPASDPVVVSTVIPFVDVSTNAYYYDAVYWAVKYGITFGTSDTTFSPSDPCTRAQMVAFLWRAAGRPEPQTSEMPFTDVKTGSYYAKAVLWAVENGITKGTSATTFSPDAACNRAQAITFLWNFQGSPAAGTANPFTDVAADAFYADAVLWAAENGIAAGTSDTTFSPNMNCTRAQIVAFLYRCLGR